MAKAAAPVPALATSAIGSFVAGTIATMLLTFSTGRRELRGPARPADYFALMVLSFVTSRGRSARSLMRGMLALFVGLSIGPVGIDQISGQARLRSACPSSRRHRHRARRRRPVRGRRGALRRDALRTGEDEIARREGRAGCSRAMTCGARGAVAARHRARLPVRRDARPAAPRSRPSSPTRPSSRLAPAQGGIRHGRDRGRRRTGAADNAAFTGELVPLLTSASRPRRPPRSSSPRSRSRPPARAAAVHQGARPGVGADRLALRRQRDAAGLNLPLVGMWVKLLEIPRRLLTAAILVFATLGVYSVLVVHRAARDVLSSASSASSCAASTSPSRR